MDASFQADWERGRWDVPFWAKRFFDVDLHPGQVRFANTVRTRDHTYWRAAYLTICLSAGNRAGKTLALAIVILHSMFYKIGLRPPDGSVRDLKRWMIADYQWYHFAIRQEIAELVYWEMVKLFQGVHGAQKSGIGCPLTADVPEIASWDKKYQGDFRWFRIDPMWGGAEVHFRTTVEQALGTLGRDMHGISYDECAFDDKLEFVYGEILNTRRLGTGGQLLLVSTPSEGITAFSDFWEMGNPDAPDRNVDRMSVRMSSRENVGFGLDRVTFDRMLADMSPELVPQNIDGYFIEGRSNYFPAASVDKAFRDGMPEQVNAEHLHVYVQGVDAALTDATWSIVFDCTDQNHVFGVKVERKRKPQTTDSILALTIGNHNAYNVARPDLRSSCATAIDSTGWGGKMFKEMLGGISPVRSIEFGGSRQRKLKLLGDLKTMLDTGKLVMPRTGLWLAVRRQLGGYKLEDRKIEQDAVMALACAVAEIRRSASPLAEPVAFNPFVPDDGVPRTARWTIPPKGG